MGILDRAKEKAAEAASDAMEKRSQAVAEKKEKKEWEKRHKVVASLKCDGETMNLRDGFIEYVTKEEGIGGVKALGDVSAVRVETGDELQSRVTVTRVLLIGIFALAAKKKSGGEKYLTVEGDDFVWAMEVPRKNAKDAIKFAARVDNAVRQARSSAS